MNVMESLFPSGIIPCATSYVDRACTIADIFVLAQNFSKFLLVIVVPGILIIMVPYLVIKMLTLGNRPEVRQSVYRSVWYIFIGLFFTFGAYVAMSLVINALGFKAQDSPLKGVLQSDSGIIMRAYAQVSPAPNGAPAATSGNVVKFQNPLEYTEVGDALYSIGNTFVFMAVIVVVFAFIRSGFLFLGGANNRDRRTRAKFWLMLAVGGGVLIFGLEALISIITNTFLKFGGS